ncbi:unnamed protein product [Caretta caretta]
MEKGGRKRFGKLFHCSESEDSEPEMGAETPSTRRDRRQVGSGSSSSRSPPEREPKKCSAFSHWRPKKRQHLGEGGGMASSPPSALCATPDPGTSTTRYVSIERYEGVDKIESPEDEPWWVESDDTFIGGGENQDIFNSERRKVLDLMK